MAITINSESYNDKYIILEAQSKHYLERVIAARSHILRELIKLQLKIWLKSFLVMIRLKRSNK